MEQAILKMKKPPKPKKNPEYEQGTAAQKRFEQTMKALFRAPKRDSKKAKNGKD
jgi:hypothetical protein